MKTQWQIYKELELLPDSIPQTGAANCLFALHLNKVWRVLSNTLSVKLPHDEQRVEYLERCLLLDCGRYVAVNNSWQKLWTVLNQLLWQPQSCPEPQIWQRSDRAGYTWWHVYDPITGRTAQLESEEAVQIWLEERFYSYKSC